MAILELVRTRNGVCTLTVSAMYEPPYQGAFEHGAVAADQSAMTPAVTKLHVKHEPFSEEDITQRISKGA